MNDTGGGTAPAFLRIDQDRCLSCGACVAVCPAEALLLEGLDLRFDREACVRCGECFSICPRAALVSAAPDREAS